MTNTTSVAAAICRAVAELPDRNSPADWPEAMLVTHTELEDIINDTLRAARVAAQDAPADQPAPAVVELAAGEPMFWVRVCSDGCYEGPIHNDKIELVRKCSGAWTPLYTPAQMQGMLAQGLAPGWKVVPLEPTPEMTAKAHRPDRYGYGHVSGHVGCDIYKTMIAAAPQPQQVAPQAAAAMAAEYGRWIGYFHRGDGDYNDFLRIELDHGDDLRTVRADACALGLKEAS